MIKAKNNMRFFGGKEVELNYVFLSPEIQISYNGMTIRDDFNNLDFSEANLEEIGMIIDMMLLEFNKKCMEKLYKRYDKLIKEKNLKNKTAIEKDIWINDNSDIKNIENIENINNNVNIKNINDTILEFANALGISPFEIDISDNQGVNYLRGIELREMTKDEKDVIIRECRRHKGFRTISKRKQEREKEKEK